MTRFRALISDHLALKDFINIATTLSKISKELVMRITPQKVYFILSEESGPRQPLVWCELPVAYYFKEFSVVSKRDNEVYLELSSVMLSKTLATMKQNAKWLKLKLTDKQCPCLTLDVELVNNESNFHTRQCTHDIPTNLIAHQYWGNYDKPQIADFHVSMTMPPLKPMKNIVERMKNINNTHLTISANKEGRLILNVRTQTAKVRAHFPNLNVISFAVDNMAPETTEADGGGDDDEDCVTTTVDIKKFLMFLNGLQLHNYETVLSIVQGRMVKLSMEQPGALLMEVFLTELNE